MLNFRDFNLSSSCGNYNADDNDDDDAKLFILQSSAAATTANSSSAAKVTSGELTLTTFTCILQYITCCYHQFIVDAPHTFIWQITFR